MKSDEQRDMTARNIRTGIIRVKIVLLEVRTIWGRTNNILLSLWGVLRTALASKHIQHGELEKKTQAVKQNNRAALGKNMTFMDEATASSPNILLQLRWDSSFK